MPDCESCVYEHSFIHSLSFVIIMTSECYSTNTIKGRRELYTGPIDPEPRLQVLRRYTRCDLSPQHAQSHETATGATVRTSLTRRQQTLRTATCCFGSRSRAGRYEGVNETCLLVPGRIRQELTFMYISPLEVFMRYERCNGR